LALTIIMEWDNVLLAEMSRCEAMLDRLGQQIERLLNHQARETASGLRVADQIQVILAFDIDEVPEDELVRDARRALAGVESHIIWTLAPARGATYYELKNFAVQRATGDIVVLLDSDAIPEADWLERLIGPFTDPSIDVVGGGSYIELGGIYAKSFALGWLFPLRKKGDLHEATSFYANNVAFRAEIIRSHPFPSLPGACRGAGRLLANELIEADVRIYRNPEARISHPPPRPRHFVRRGIAQGRDNLIRTRFLTGTESVPFRHSWDDARRRTTRAWRRILNKRNQVQIKVVEIPVAMLIIGSYYGLYLAGDMLMRAAPRTMVNAFRI